MNKPKENLLNEIKSEQVVRGGIRPALIIAIERLDGEDRADLLDALHDETYSGASISRALINRGFKVSAAAINSYRRGEIVHVPKI